MVLCHSHYISGNMKIHTVSQIRNFDREKFTFITWDQPGYGKSTPPERNVNDQSLIEDTDIMVEFMRVRVFIKIDIHRNSKTILLHNIFCTGVGLTQIFSNGLEWGWL